MRLGTLLTSLSLLQRPGALGLLRDLTVELRRDFIYAALRSGLLDALDQPRSAEELAVALEVRRPDLLEALLALGLAVGELRRDGERFRLVGSRSRAAREDEGLAGLVEALHTYYNSVYRELPARLAGAPNGDDLARIGPLVARVSRISEPYLQGFIRRAVAGSGPRRLLELGCGSCAHLKTAALANPALTGIGLDVDPAVVEAARANLAQWQLDGRFSVHPGDLRRPPAAAAGPFDVITLHNLIYYFRPDERGAVLASLRALLRPGGELALVTSAQGREQDVVTANLDVATRSLQGCWPLPELGELEAQLQTAGFSSVRRERLMPGAAFWGLTARS